MVLETLLAPLSVQQFLDAHYQKLPFAHRGGCSPYIHLASWDTLARILSCEGADVIVGREGKPYPEKPRKLEDCKALLQAGQTLGFRSAEKADPGLQSLATEFRQELGAPVDIHLYCTAANEPGFGWHYDAEDVFIFQCSGSKDWSLRKNSVHPWPLIDALPADMRFEREITPLMRCRLEPGDWLYIPAGYWHKTHAGDESFSLSIGVRSLTALDLLDFLRAQVCRHSLLWRQRLPPLGKSSSQSDESVRERYAQIAQLLADDLAKLLPRGDTLDAFIRAKRQETS